MRPSERLKSMAESSRDPGQKALFLQQFFRLHVGETIGDCIACAASPNKVGVQGKSPAFLSLVTHEPMNIDWIEAVGREMGKIGLSSNDIGFVSRVQCSGGDVRACGQNFRSVWALHSSRIWVLTGQTASVIYANEIDMARSHGTWSEGLNNGVKVWYFLTHDPREDFKGFTEDISALGSLFHYAWTIFMGELYPGSHFVHSLTYEQICDVVANEFKAVLQKIPEGRRTDEFMRIMSRILADNRAGEGMATRAFYDDEFAAKCGIDPRSLRGVVHGF